MTDNLPTTPAELDHLDQAVSELPTSASLVYDAIVATASDLPAQLTKLANYAGNLTPGELLHVRRILTGQLARSDAGGWSSGACAPATPAPRPQYHPTMLVRHVEELLRADGITVTTPVDPLPAKCAAADLLRALGVDPASAPRR